MESGMSSVGAYLRCDDRSMLVVFEHHQHAVVNLEMYGIMSHL